jgi:CheY-like chemotaxis protein
MPKVLLVDGARRDLRLFAGLLARVHCSVLTAAGSEEALRIARMERPDLVVFDVGATHDETFEDCRLAMSGSAGRVQPTLVLGGEERVEEIIRVLALVERAAPRVPVDAEISFWRGGEPRYGRLVDLSASGFFVASSHPEPAGSRLEIAFTLPNDFSGRFITGEAIVTRHSERPRRGFGSRFGLLSSATRRLIDEYVGWAGGPLEETRPRAPSSTSLSV